MAVDFTDSISLVARLRAAVDDTRPDAVMVSESWCTKAPLATAFVGRRVLIRLHAYEILCPTNGRRLILNRGAILDCPNNALETPELCRICVRDTLLRTPGHSLRAVEARAGDAASLAYYSHLPKALDTAEAIFVPSSAGARWLGRHAARAVLAPPGANPERFENTVPARRAARPVVYMPGTIEDPLNGFDALAEACGILWAVGYDFEVWAQARQAAVLASGRLKLLGALEPGERASHLAAADVCVFPSVWEESLGTSAVEAMAVGKPVIASRAGSLEDVVVDGSTGMLMARRDAAGLASAIGGLLKNPGMAARMGEAGRKQFLERYTWERVVEHVYLPVLHHERRASQKGSAARKLASASGAGRRQDRDSSRRKAPLTRDQILAEVLGAGSDSLATFGGVFEGGARLQQVPDEFTDLVWHLATGGQTFNRYLEIGAAAGGAARLLHRFLGFESAVIVDNNQHPRHTIRPANLRSVPRREFIGDSHSLACLEFLRSLDRQYELIFIDGDHSYEGVRADTLLAAEFCADGALLIFHDINVCDGVRSWTGELKAGVLPDISHCRDFAAEGKSCGLGLFRYAR